MYKMDDDPADFQSFLRESKKEIEKIIASGNEEENSIHLVIGNESGDIDSIVSAVVYSFFKEKEKADSCSTIFAPILNFPKEDMVLKTEVNAIFERLGLQLADCLLFKDCLLELWSTKCISGVTLVDHNSLSEDLQFLYGSVAEIIDHHVDTKAFDDPCISKTVEFVGSCCTLVAEKIYNKAEDLFKVYPVGELLLSAILLDTVNLKTGIGRTTVKDVEFVEELEPHSKVPLNELFKIAERAKHSVRHLSSRDILRKDFKAVHADGDVRFGISSISMDARDFLARENSIEDVQAFSAQHSLDLTLLMFIYFEDAEAKRDLVIYSKDQALRETFLRYLLGTDELKLTQNECSCSIVDFVKQGDSKYSRKLLMPFVRNFFQKKHEHCNSENNNKVAWQRGILESQDDFSAGRKRKSSTDHEEVSHGKLLELRGQSSNQVGAWVENSCEDCSKNGLLKSETGDMSRVSPHCYDNKSQLPSEETLPTESSVRAALEEAYADIDHDIEQPSLEFEDNWQSQMYDVKSPTSSDQAAAQKHTIIFHDLSFDDNGPFSELSGIDLLCPVFLAVTEDDEDDDVVLKDIRRKTKSIENLCSALDDEQDFPLRRTKSELPSSYQKKTALPGSFNKRKWRTSLSERNSLKIDRNNSIQEEDQDTTPDNPFAGNRDFSDDSEARSSVSSSGFGSPSKQDANPVKDIKRFSFSDEEEREQPDTAACSCSLNDDGEWANQIGCEQHVPGLWDRFISVSVGGLLRVIDLKLIDPYIKIITHGGIHESGIDRRVVMVFTAAYLPERYIPKYEIVMEQLFYYAVHTIDLSVQTDYDIVYFNSRGSNQPGLDWLRKCYDMVQRRLKKNLNTLYIVHPDFWLKTVLRFYKPFISSKFSRTIHFVKSLHELRQSLSLEYIFIPDEVKRNDPESAYWLLRFIHLAVNRERD